MDKKLEVINRKNSTTINIYDVSNINLQELNNLDIINNNLIVEFEEEIQDVDKIIEIINYLYKKYRTNFIFIIKDDTKKATLIKDNYKKCNDIINSDKLEKKAEKYVFVPVPVFTYYDSLTSELEYVRLDRIKEVEQFIFLFKKELNNSGLSNFEKVLATYNTVIKLLRYKIDNSCMGASCRNIYYIFQSNAIVCMGYINILSRLLTEIGITNQKVITNDKLHARIMININDDKYQIHGNYLSDPTEDSSRYFEFKDRMKNYWCDEVINTILPLMTMIDNFCLTEKEATSDFSKLYEKDKGLGFIEKTEEKIERFLSLDKISHYKKINALYSVNKYIFKNKMTDSDFIDACTEVLAPTGIICNMELAKAEKMVTRTVQKRKIYSKN